jgi:hypothetical protein
MGVCLYICDECGKLSHEGELKTYEEGVDEPSICKKGCVHKYTPEQLSRLKDCWYDNNLGEDISYRASIIWKHYLETFEYVLDYAASGKRKSQKFVKSLEMLKAFRRRSGDEKEMAKYVESILNMLRVY